MTGSNPSQDGSSQSSWAGAESLGYGRRAGAGVLWMLLSTVITKGASFAAQVVLGWILLKEDFGLWAIALSVTSFVQVLKDGGTRKIVVQKGVGRFDRLCAPIFWIGTAFNAVTAVVIALLAIPASHAYDAPALVEMMLIIAAGTLIGSPDMIYKAKLTVDMRYRALSRFQMLSGLVRFGSTIVLAVSGFGASSFAWPIVLQAVFGWVYGRAVVGAIPIWGNPKYRLWPILFNATVWMLVGAIGLTALRMAPYAILGLMHPQDVLAVYFFAYQLLVQIDVLIAYNLQSVLLPTLTAIKDDVVRHRDAVLRAAGGLSLVGGCLGMGFGVVVHDVVRFVWADKWIESAPAVQWMAVFFGFRMLQAVFEPAMLSRNMYRQWAWLMLIQGAIVSVASVGVGLLFDQPWQFAVAVGASFVCSMGIVGLWGARMIGLPIRAVLWRVSAPWLVSIGPYAAVIYARVALGLNDEASRLVLVINAFVCAMAFGVLTLLSLRVMLPGVLRDALAITPGGVGVRISRILRL